MAAEVYVDVSGTCYHKSHADVPGLDCHLRHCASWQCSLLTTTLTEAGCTPHLSITVELTQMASKLVSRTYGHEYRKVGPTPHLPWSCVGEEEMCPPCLSLFAAGERARPKDRGAGGLTLLLAGCITD